MFLSLPLVTWLGGTTQFAPFFIDSRASQSHAAKLTGKTYLGSFHWPGIFLCSFFIIYSQVFLGFRYHSCTHSFTHQTHTELFHLSHSVCSGESKDEREISIFKEFKVEIQTSQLWRNCAMNAKDKGKHAGRVHILNWPGKAYQDER